MTSPLPPTPAPPPAPQLPPNPPVTVTTTATVVVPPPDVNVTNLPPDQGLGGWAVPIATLIAALIAATFLSINEALKRRREDRRQWDKEIRDHCANAIAAADTVIMAVDSRRALVLYEKALARKNARDTETEQSGVSRLSKLVSKARRRLSDDADSTLSVGIKQRAENRKRMQEAASEITSSVKSLELIARPNTRRAAANLRSTIHDVTYKFDDSDTGREVLEARDAVGDAQTELIDACKADIRIGRRRDAPTNIDTFLCEVSPTYRRSPQWLKRRTYNFHLGRASVLIKLSGRSSGGSSAGKK